MGARRTRFATFCCWSPSIAGFRRQSRAIASRSTCANAEWHEPCSPSACQVPQVLRLFRPSSSHEIFVEELRQMPVVIRIVCAVLIAFLSVVTGAAAQTSAKGPVTVFNFTFPEEVAGAQRISFRDYESNQPGLGYSAGYKQGNLTGTVYIYDDRKQSIPDDPQSPLVKAQLEQSRRDVVVCGG